MTPKTTFGVDYPSDSARFRRTGPAFAALARHLTETARERSDDMPGMGSNPVAGTESSTAPNVGQIPEKINDHGDNWQHISSPVGRIVADVMRRMEERRRGNG